MKSAIKEKEFVAIMAVIMSFGALSIDAMLPALGEIGSSLEANSLNSTQYIISSVFAGMSLGLLFFGPISDAYGRKNTFILGVSTFIIGCFISYYSKSFDVMIWGRFLQGVGSASCRVITMAMIRDKFSGRQMAKTMSLIFIVFILVPVFAPSIGQLIINISGWRDIFLFMLILSFVSTIWFYLRQEETLSKKNRIKLSIANIKKGTLETLRTKASMVYMTAAGFNFGALVAYLSTSQQVFQQQYHLGDRFPIVFGALAFFIGCSSFLNSRLVEKFGMRKLCIKALIFYSSLALVFLFISIGFNGNPPLIALLIYLALSFSCLGLLFGNLNSLSLQPLGHIAGVANSVISSLQTFISVGLGASIGSFYNHSITPLVAGYFFCSFTAYVMIKKFTHSTQDN